MIVRHERLVAAGGMLLESFHCQGRSRRWSEPMTSGTFGLCLMRVGGFRRAAEGQDEFVDAAHGFVSHVGVQGRFVDAPGVDYRYTWFALTPEQYAAHVEGVERWNGWLLTTGTALDLRHRDLLTAVRRGLDPFEAAERLLVLLEALPPRTDRSAPGLRPQTWAARRRLVGDAQEALAAGGPRLGLDELSALVSSSPHHLSRVFRQVTGRTVTDYRNELRVRSVLERLPEEAASLTNLAAQHGFVDQAHLTRTVRRYQGRTPSVLRSQLSMKVQDR